MQITIGGAVWILLCICGIYCQTDDAGSISRYPPPVNEDKVDKKCWNFTIGNKKIKEFYSPNYPNNYFNQTYCTFVLEAPEDKIIELDFRDDFHIEMRSDQKCIYDYLEIRDGPFGYSRLIGRFCGTLWPPLTLSSSRYLWLAFKSDENIEYKGFRATYNFLPDPGFPYPGDILNNTVCLINVNHSRVNGLISSEDIPKKVMRRARDLNSPLDCTWVIYAPKGYRVHIPPLLHYKMTSPGECKESFFEVYGHNSAEKAELKRFCTQKTSSISSPGNLLLWRVYAKNLKLLPEFKALYTFYTSDAGDETCAPGMFRCEKDFCISDTLRCNNEKNCENSNDEQNCQVPTEEPLEPPGPVKVQYHTIILGIVGGLIITVIVISICITCQQRRREERRRQHAMRQERHTIEMTTSLLNRTPQSGRHSEPDGSPGMNHIGMTNRVANSTAHNGKHPSVHSQLNGGRNALNSRQHPLHKISDFETEVACDGTVDANTGTFKRFLDVHNYSDEDNVNSKPSLNRNGNQISALVTVEHAASRRRLSSEGATGRDKSPSPRPDIVQEERFTYPDPVTEPKRDRFTTARQNDKTASYQQQSDNKKVISAATTPEYRRRNAGAQRSPVTPRAARSDRKTPPPPPPPVIHRPLDARTFTSVPDPSVDYGGVAYYKAPRSKVQHHPV